MANVQNVVGLVPALGVDGQQVVVGQAEYQHITLYQTVQ